MTDGFVWCCVEFFNTNKQNYRAKASKKYLPEGPGDDVVAEPNICPGIKHMQ